MPPKIKCLFKGILACAAAYLFAAFTFAFFGGSSAAAYVPRTEPLLTPYGNIFTSEAGNIYAFGIRADCCAQGEYYHLDEDGALHYTEPGLPHFSQYTQTGGYK
ncbi:MAG: hypothetical protein FWE24_02235 [Defluviitaleaceae bacterium]|nr:hypothetical protein [Defluviitaleaceae bacterium]